MKLGHRPTDRPRLIAAADGTLAAVVERTRITVIDLATGGTVTEVAADPAADGFDVAWLGTPARLLVLTRHAGHSTAHLVDVHGPRTVAEIRLPSPMRLFAAVAQHGLAIGAQGAAVLTAGVAHLTPYQFPGRGLPLAAGAAGAQFLVALPGGIEEWDPGSRMPKRRLRLPRPAALTALGGSERAAWVLTQQEPSRIDVLPLVSRGQPKLHELPEPIAAVASHPRSDLIACVGAGTGRLYVIDLDGKSGMRVVGLEGLERVEAAALVVGRTVGVLVAQQGRQLELVPLESRGEVAAAAPAAGPGAGAGAIERARLTIGASGGLGGGDDDDAPAPPKPSSLYDPEAPDEAAPSGGLLPPAAPSVESRAAIASASAAPAMPSAPIGPAAPAMPAAPAAPATPAAPASTARPSRSNLAERFAAVRERRLATIASPREGSGPITPLREGSGPITPPREGSGPITPPVPARASASASASAAGWRDDCVGWVRSMLGAAAAREPPAIAVIDELAAQHELPAELTPALVLLYGAHLAGEAGVAPADLAKVLGGRWDEALGRGQLAARGLIELSQSRVQLVAAIERALDDQP